MDNEKEIIRLLFQNNPKLIEVFISWVDKECKKLENPYNFPKDNFSIEGQANLKACAILRKFFSSLMKPEKSEVKKTKYK